jgi:hypothetical protein
MGERTRNAALLEDSGTPQALVRQARASVNSRRSNSARHVGRRSHSSGQTPSRNGLMMQRSPKF